MVTYCWWATRRNSKNSVLRWEIFWAIIIGGWAGRMLQWMRRRRVERRLRSRSSTRKLTSNWHNREERTVRRGNTGNEEVTMRRGQNKRLWFAQNRFVDKRSLILRRTWCHVFVSMRPFAAGHPEKTIKHGFTKKDVGEVETTVQKTIDRSFPMPLLLLFFRPPSTSTRRSLEAKTGGRTAPNQTSISLWKNYFVLSRGTECTLSTFMIMVWKQQSDKYVEDDTQKDVKRGLRSQNLEPLVWAARKSINQKVSLDSR